MIHIRKKRILSGYRAKKTGTVLDNNYRIQCAIERD